MKNSRQTPGTDPPRLAPGGSAPLCGRRSVSASPLSTPHPAGTPPTFLAVAEGWLPTTQARLGQGFFSRSLDQVPDVHRLTRLAAAVSGGLYDPRGLALQSGRPPRLGLQAAPAPPFPPRDVSLYSEGSQPHPSGSDISERVARRVEAEPSRHGEPAPKGPNPPNSHRRESMGELSTRSEEPPPRRPIDLTPLPLDLTSSRRRAVVTQSERDRSEVLELQQGAIMGAAHTLPQPSSGNEHPLLLGVPFSANEEAILMNEEEAAHHRRTLEWEGEDPGDGTGEEGGREETESEQEEGQEEEAGTETGSETSRDGPGIDQLTASETELERPEVEEPDSDRALETPHPQDGTVLTVNPAELQAAGEDEGVGIYCMIPPCFSRTIGTLMPTEREQPCNSSAVTNTGASCLT